MTDPSQKLKDMKPENEFFIGIDSDGCVFDTMEIKHKECFCPQFVNHFELQPVAKYARESWEFVNLYSKTRGVNRFIGLIRALDLLAERKEVNARGVAIKKLQSVRDWLDRETKLGNPALAAEVEKTGDADLKTAFDWSTDVNDMIKAFVRNVPPFPYVKQSLEKLAPRADCIVVSQTPCEALEREWGEHGIARYTRIIAGQEMGSKAEHIAFAASGKYAPEKILMVGDALGDLNAAKNNKALFYPINPGDEEQSWQRFYEEGLDRFFDGSYTGDYEKRLIEEFDAHLPQKAPWQG
jgi:phosphoglycolate phosphatase-like HAD superfamily hydrolase